MAARPRLILVLTENWTIVPPDDPIALVGLAREAEAAGVDAVMLSEHVVLGGDAAADGLMSNPREYALPGNQDPATSWPSSVVLLGAIAAATSRLRLVAGAILAPLRHPLLLARELGTLDLLSRGRLVVLPSVGWHEPEYRRPRRGLSPPRQVARRAARNLAGGLARIADELRGRPLPLRRGLARTEGVPAHRAAALVRWRLGAPGPRSPAGRLRQRVQPARGDPRRPARPARRRAASRRPRPRRDRDGRWATRVVSRRRVDRRPRGGGRGRRSAPARARLLLVLLQAEPVHRRCGRLGRALPRGGRARRRGGRPAAAGSRPPGRRGPRPGRAPDDRRPDGGPGGAGNRRRHRDRGGASPDASRRRARG